MSSLAEAGILVPGPKIATDPAWRRSSYTAGDDEDVRASEAFELGLQSRQERLVSGGERQHRDDVDVVFDCLLGGFLRGLEGRADVRVELEVVVAGGWPRPWRRGRVRPAPFLR
jgi:hypothetical protein